MHFSGHGGHDVAHISLHLFKIQNILISAFYAFKINLRVIADKVSAARLVAQLVEPALKARTTSSWTHVAAL
jgi:hypothetical protein